MTLMILGALLQVRPMQSYASDRDADLFEAGVVECKKNLWFRESEIKMSGTVTIKPKKEFSPSGGKYVQLENAPIAILYQVLGEKHYSEETIVNASGADETIIDLDDGETAFSWGRNVDALSLTQSGTLHRGYLWHVLALRTLDGNATKGNIAKSLDYFLHKIKEGAYSVRGDVSDSKWEFHIGLISNRQNDVNFWAEITFDPTQDYNLVHFRWHCDNAILGDAEVAIEYERQDKHFVPVRARKTVSCSESEMDIDLQVTEIRIGAEAGLDNGMFSRDRLKIPLGTRVYDLRADPVASARNQGGLSRLTLPCIGVFMIVFCIGILIRNHRRRSQGPV